VCRMKEDYEHSLWDNFVIGAILYAIELYTLQKTKIPSPSNRGTKESCRIWSGSDDEESITHVLTVSCLL
jgi:hypothetical protein